MGTKVAKQRRRMVTLVVVCILLIAVVLFSALTPTGPFEYLENTIRTIGNGSFPAAVSGSELLNAHSVGNLTYVLTDTHAEVYNSSGKQLFSRQHEFNAPALAVSSQRAVVYDMGGKKMYIYNHSDVIREMTLENEIYCADIGRNGTIAVSTKSTGYASEVHVFNRNGDTKYIWYSSDETVNNVSVSNDGKKIAVSTVTVSGGEYRSKVYVFRYSSADPLYQFSYDNTIIYSINCVSGTRFAVVTDDSIDYVKWKTGERVQNTNQYTLNIYRYKINSWNIAVTGNKSRNTVSVFDKNGEKIADIDFDGSISDVSMNGNSVFIMSDGYMYTYDTGGNETAEKINISSYGRVFALDENTAIVAGNFGLNKISTK